MAEPSNVSVAHALRDGLARAASAPAVLVGTFAAARILNVPSVNLWFLDRGARAVLVWLLFWSIAYGGVVDRLARNRPTRAHGFFAACGVHAMPLARLSIITIAVEAALAAFAVSWTATPGGRTALAFVLLAGGAVLGFARIRLVVEDRRSAIGALLASLRFLRRNPSGVLLLVVFGLAAYGLNDLYAATVASGLFTEDWQYRVSSEAFLAVQLWVKLVGYSAAIALFQSRLAHAGYTAAPPAVWPESASAEAIANAAPRIAP